MRPDVLYSLYVSGITVVLGDSRHLPTPARIDSEARTMLLQMNPNFGSRWRVLAHACDFRRGRKADGTVQEFCLLRNGEGKIVLQGQYLNR